MSISGYETRSKRRRSFVQIRWPAKPIDFVLHLFQREATAFCKSLVHLRQCGAARDEGRVLCTVPSGEMVLCTVNPTLFRVRDRVLVRDTVFQ
jgi:hypothetical protein